MEEEGLKLKLLKNKVEMIRVLRVPLVLKLVLHLSYLMDLMSESTFMGECMVGGRTPKFERVSR